MTRLVSLAETRKVKYLGVDSRRAMAMVTKPLRNAKGGKEMLRDNEHIAFVKNPHFTLDSDVKSLTLRFDVSIEEGGQGASLALSGEEIVNFLEQAAKIITGEHDPPILIALTNIVRSLQFCPCVVWMEPSTGMRIVKYRRLIDPKK
jgi:hypothetical protein